MNASTGNKWRRTFCVMCVLFLTAAVTGTFGLPSELAAQRASPETPGSFSALVEKAGPSVVNIRTTQVVTARDTVPDQLREFFEKFFRDQFPEEREFRQRSLGSGFIIDEEGLIFTNDHVIARAEEILVMLEDGQEFPAEIVGRDPQTDLALIRIETGFPLQPLTFGSSDDIAVGEWVVAIGNPFALGNTVTAGIISAKHRRIGAGAYDSFIQTDASINPGNSGGPLLNTAGEAVGINTAIFTGHGGNIGIGFATPIDIAKDLLPQLKEGRVVRGWLGVMIQTISPAIQEKLGLDSTKGALVSSISEGGPADKAGIERGDVIMSFDGKEIAEMHDLPHIVAITEAGKTVPVEIIRDGEKEIIQVTIEEMAEEEPRPAPEPAEAPFELGVRLKEITPEIARRYNLPEISGLVVVGVQPGSPSAQAGLQTGDAIVEIDREEIHTLAGFREKLTEYSSGETLLLTINREGNFFFTTLEMP